MAYIAKAHVKCGSDLFKEIAKKLTSIGYRESGVNLLARDKGVKIHDGLYEGILADEIKGDLGSVDCNALSPNGTEEEAVKLFLELAQMDEDDANTMWVKMEQPKETRGTHWIETTYHKDWSSSNELIEAVCENRVTTLTPLEVAQAFKDGRIEL